MNFKVFHIQESVERDHVEGGLFSKLKLLCTTKKYFFPFFLLNCLIVLVLLTGVSTMNVYANEMFQRAGGHMNRYLSNIIIGLLQLAGSCLFLPLVKIFFYIFLFLFFYFQGQGLLSQAALRLLRPHDGCQPQLARSLPLRSDQVQSCYCIFDIQITEN